jgi:hypothetical protein
LVHDRDRNDPGSLRAKLEAILRDVPLAKKVVAIPEEELEAWLLSDTAAINTALKLDGKFKKVNHPERIKAPKEHIQKNVYKISDKKKNYINNVHNKLIAEHINIKEISGKCPSFAPFLELFERKKKL